MPQLIVIREDDFPRIYELETDKATIGRRKDNHIVLQPSPVSAYHAVITKEDGVFLLSDRNSNNGTEVNGQKINESARLEDGDRLSFGPVKAIFLDPHDSVVSDPNNPEEIKKLLRQSEIERNNLHLIKNDLGKVRIELTNVTKQRNDLTEEVADLTAILNDSEKALQENQSESKRLTDLIDEALRYQKNSKELKANLKNRQAEHQALAEKIQDGEKRFDDLDLDNSIKKKQQLVKDFEQLKKQIGESNVELERITKAADEASAVFDEAKRVESHVAEIKKDIEEKTAQQKELATLISDREQKSSDLVKQIEAHQKQFEQNKDKATEEIKGLDSTIEAKQSKVEQLDLANQEKQKLIATAESKLKEINQQIQKGDAELSQSQNSQKSLEKEIFTLNRIVGEKSGVLRRLSAKINSRGTDVICPPIRLINPQMNCLVHFFHHGAGVPDEERFDPIGYPALAACTRGSMHRDVDSIVSEGDPILLILSGDWPKDHELIQSTRAVMPNSLLFACWGEGQLPQFAEAEGTTELLHLLNRVTGVISIEPRTAKLFENLTDLECAHLNLPLPSPVEFPEWDLSLSIGDRTRGLFINGDGWNPDSNLHRARIELLNRLIKETKTTVTLFQSNPSAFEELIVPQELIQYYEGQMSFSNYLKIAAQHYLFSGFGRNELGGEITGDAVLSRTLFVGADREQTFDQLLFPNTCIQGKDYKEALKQSKRLLKERDIYYESSEQTQNLATQLISFDAARDRLREFIESLSS